MADITLSVEGLSGVVANLLRAEEHLMAGVQESFVSALQLVYDESQANVRVRTGKLKASGVKTVGHLEGSVSYGNDEVDYADFVELGTRKQPAQPYLFPAYVSGMRQLKEDLGLTL